MKGKNVRSTLNRKRTQNGPARICEMDTRSHEQLLGMQAMLKLLAQSQDSLAKGEKTYSTAEVRRRTRAVQTASRSTA